MNIKIYHLHIKATGEDRYYTSIAALFKNNTRSTLRTSKSTIYHHNFTHRYENDYCIIKREEAISAGKK